MVQLIVTTRRVLCQAAGLRTGCPVVRGVAVAPAGSIQFSFWNTVRCKNLSGRQDMAAIDRAYRIYTTPIGPTLAHPSRSVFRPGCQPR